MRFPKDTDDTIYVHAHYISYDLDDLLNRARCKWGDEIGLEHLSIGAEYIQINCFGYDLYDPADWACFITITVDSKFKPGA